MDREKRTCTEVKNLDARTKQFLDDPPLPLLLRMSAPNSVAFLIQSSVSVTEVWFIGQLGTASLAATRLQAFIVHTAVS